MFNTKHTSYYCWKNFKCVFEIIVKDWDGMGVGLIWQGQKVVEAYEVIELIGI